MYEPNYTPVNNSPVRITVMLSDDVLVDVDDEGNAVGLETLDGDVASGWQAAIEHSVSNDPQFVLPDSYARDVLRFQSNYRRWRRSSTC